MRHDRLDFVTHRDPVHSARRDRHTTTLSLVDHSSYDRDDAQAFRERLSAVAELLKVAGQQLEDDGLAPSVRIARVAALLRSASEYTHHNSATVTKLRGGLAPWQARRIAAYIDAHLASTIRTEELAQEVQLSVSHFCRAFKDSFGESPHNYIMKKRLDQAKSMMLTTTESLGQIAAACGFADQAHLCKRFRRVVGASPSTWRRTRSHEPTPVLRRAATTIERPSAAFYDRSAREATA